MANPVYYERVSENQDLMSQWLVPLTNEQFDEIKTNVPGNPLHGNIVSLDKTALTHQQLLDGYIPIKIYLYGTRYKGIVKGLYFDRNWSVWSGKIYPAFMLRGESSWQLGMSLYDANGSLINYDPGHQIYYIVGPSNTVYKIVAKPFNGSLVIKPKPNTPEVNPPIVVIDEDGGTTVIDEPPRLGSGQIYCPIDPKDIIQNVTERSTTGIWFNNEPRILQLYNKEVDRFIDFNELPEYYDLDFQLNVTNKKYNVECIENQFTIYYANYNGHGSKDLEGYDDETMTKAMYSQFANILLPSNQNKFSFNGTEVDDIYVIKINRSLFKDYLDLGNWELTLSKINPDESTSYTNDSTIQTISLNAPSTQTGNFITLIDESRLTDNLDLKLNMPYKLIYGSLEDNNLNSSNVVYFPGYVYPQFGLIVMSAQALDSLLNFRTNRNVERSGCNTVRLYNSIQNVTVNAWTDSTGDRLGFKARNIKYKNSKIYFIRKKNGQLTYSNNPTYVKNNEGEIIDSFKGIAKSYFTTVGLFNEIKELLAVGKLSKPLLSTTTDESLLTVKVSI